MSETPKDSRPDQRPCSGLRVDLKRCLLQTDCCRIKKKTPLACLQEGDIDQECRALSYAFFECKRSLLICKQLVLKMSRSVQIFNLSRALRSQSDYARRMNYLSASIFGEVRRPTDKTSMNLVKAWSRQPYETRKEIVQYYPAHDEIAQLMTHLRNYGLYRNEHEDFKEEMERLRALRGKSRKDRRKKKDA